MDQSTDLISRHDPEGVFLYASSAARVLLGMSPQELLGVDGYALVHPDDVARVAESHRIVVQTLQPGTVAYRVRRAHGTWVWVETTGHALTDGTGAVTEIQCATRDITDRMTAQDRLGAAEEQFRLTLDGALIGMALVSPDGPLLRVNQALCDLFGYPMRELLTKTFQQLTHPEDLDADIEQLGRLLAGDISGFRLEKRYIRGDGRVVWGLLSVGLVRADDGTPRHLVAQVLDITDRMTEHERVLRLSERDPLTGLYNRRRFREEVKLQLARAHRHRETAAVLLLDIDNFKAVNDTHGHHVGDQVLRRVADVLHRQTRNTDTVARLGGDEFAVLLPTGGTQTPDIAHTAHRVSDLIRAALRLSSIDTAPGVAPQTSIGVALLDAGVANVDQVLIAADQAMYRDKHRRDHRVSPDPQAPDQA